MPMVYYFFSVLKFQLINPNPPTTDHHYPKAQLPSILQVGGREFIGKPKDPVPVIVILKYHDQGNRLHIKLCAVLWKYCMVVFGGTNFCWEFGEDVGFHAKSTYNSLPIIIQILLLQNRTWGEFSWNTSTVSCCWLPTLFHAHLVLLIFHPVSFGSHDYGIFRQCHPSICFTLRSMIRVLSVCLHGQSVSRKLQIKYTE